MSKVNDTCIVDKLKVIIFKFFFYNKFLNAVIEKEENNSSQKNQ